MMLSFVSPSAAGRHLLLPHLFLFLLHAPDVLENPFILIISHLMMRIFYGIQAPSPFEEKHIPWGPWLSSIIFSSGCMDFFQPEDLIQPHPTSPLQKTINFDGGGAISYNFSLDPTFSLQLARPTLVGGALVMSLGQTLCIQEYMPSSTLSLGSWNGMLENYNAHHLATHCS